MIEAVDVNLCALEQICSPWKGFVGVGECVSVRSGEGREMGAMGEEGCYGSSLNFKSVQGPSEGPAPSMGRSGMCGDEGGVGRGMAGRWGIDGTLFQKPENL